MTEFIDEICDFLAGWGLRFCVLVGVPTLIVLFCLRLFIAIMQVFNV